MTFNCIIGGTPVAAYNYIYQSVQATCLIEPKDDDSFYFPTLGHTGFAWDGTLYTAGVQEPGPVYASWYSEAILGAPYRGDSATFPQAGLILLSRVALTILDETTEALTLWMQFLMQNNIINPDGTPPVGAGSYALTDNFNSELNGFLASGLAYADGVLSVIYKPDFGNDSGVTADSSSYNVNSNMVVNIDFTQDSVYLDVAVIAPPAMPTFSPSPVGVYEPGLVVTITDTTPGALVYYTLDGTTPSPPAGSYFGTYGTVTLSQTTTVTAVATSDGGQSDVVQVVYTIE